MYSSELAISPTTSPTNCCPTNFEPQADHFPGLTELDRITKGWHKMSLNSVRMTDLFIPIGRSQSSASSVRTEASVNTADASITTKSASTSPTTISSRKSGINVSPRTVGTSSPASTRYTITGPSPESRVHHTAYTINSNALQHKPDVINTRQRSLRMTPASSPIRELTMRLSKVTGTTASQSTTASKSQATQPSTPIRSSTIVIESGDKTMTPVNLADPLHSNATNFPNSGGIRSSIDPTKVDKTTPNLKADKNPAISQPLIALRSHSRSSSRSDRSFPPSAFPPEFQEKTTVQRGSPKSPSRSISIRASSSNASPRPSSPLKIQTSYQEHDGARLPVSQRQQNRTRSTSRSTLPEPAMKPSSSAQSLTAMTDSSFHRTIHHYSLCPHTSPPCTRPLNIAPVLDMSHSAPYSTLTGMCFDCDSAERRELESEILLSYNPRIAIHMTDLNDIVASLERTSPVSPISPTMPLTQFQTLNLNENLAVPRPETPDDSERHRHGSYSSLVSEDNDDEALVYRVHALENRIAELTTSRDKEVRDVWRGYTQRWGPGTLGIARGIDADRLTFGTPRSGQSSSRVSIESGRSYYGTGEGRMRVDWIRD